MIEKWMENEWKKHKKTKRNKETYKEKLQGKETKKKEKKIKRKRMFCFLLLLKNFHSSWNFLSFSSFLFFVAFCFFTYVFVTWFFPIISGFYPNIPNNDPFLKKKPSLCFLKIFKIFSSNFFFQTLDENFGWFLFGFL